MIKVLSCLIGALVAWSTYLELEVRYWDHEIDQLCAANGGRNVGLRVYERTEVPATYFKEVIPGEPAFTFVPPRQKGEAPRAEVPVIEQTVILEILNEKSPFVGKISTQLLRVSNQTILAEEFQYIRQGGGLPVVDIPGSHTCPLSDGAPNERTIYQKTFINHPVHIRTERAK